MERQVWTVNDKRVVEALREIFDRCGAEIVGEPIKFRSALYDLLDKWHFNDERVVLRIAIESNALLPFASTASITGDTAAQVMEQLRKSHMTEDDAKFVVRCIIAARGGKPDTAMEYKRRQEEERKQREEKQKQLEEKQKQWEEEQRRLEEEKKQRKKKQGHSEMSMDEGSAEAKKRLCIIGSYGEDRRSLAEALLKGKIPDIFKKYFVAPVLKFAYGTESVVKIRLNEPITFDNDLFLRCPSGLKDIIRKYNGVNLPEIEVRYAAFCDLLRKLDPYQRQQAGNNGECRSLFLDVTIYLPLESLKNEYDIAVCEAQKLFCLGFRNLETAAQKEMQAAVNEATDVIMLLNATKLWSSDEKNFMDECGRNGKLILAVDHMEQVRQEEIPAIKDYCKLNKGYFAPSARICYISTASEDIGILELTEKLAKDRRGRRRSYCG